MFIDEATIQVRAGRGGRGCVSFRREKYVPKGGPDGGDGGKGGSVILRADQGLWTLLDFQYRRDYQAPNGGHGKGKGMTGASGEDLIVPVPVGTVVRDEQEGAVLADLDRAGAELVVARGGRAGRGNARFATPTQRAPMIAEPGEEGEARTIDLELKLLADVGLVGPPNAGKSTLLATISRAHPKIADYPFTTTQPMLGVVSDDGGSFVVADIPGLIEGAHRGRGMGMAFLRHIERTALLLLMVEATSPDPQKDYDALRAELAAYSARLAELPHLLTLTKVDLLSPGAPLPRVEAPGALETLAISSVTGVGIAELLRTLGRRVRARRGRA